MESGLKRKMLMLLTLSVALLIANVPRVSSFSPSRPLGLPIRDGAELITSTTSLSSSLKNDGEKIGEGALTEANNDASPDHSDFPELNRAGLYSIRSEAQHKALINPDTDKLVVIKHFAPWCKTCQRLGPRFAKLAKDPKYKDVPIVFAEMSIDNSKRYVQQSLGVVALPTVQLYANGEIVETFAAGPKAWSTMGTRVEKFVKRSTNEDMTIKPASEVVDEVGVDEDGGEAPDEALLDAQKLLPILGGISYFKEMNDAEFEKVLSKASYATVEEGTVIIREGNFGSKLYVIVDGEVEVCRRLASTGGAPKSNSDLGYVVATLGSGAYFGERSLITREPSAASVRATATTKVVALSKFAFEKTSLLSGKSDKTAKAEEKRRLDKIYGLGGEEEEKEEEEASPAESESIIPLLVRFKLVRSIIQCFDYIASSQADFGGDSTLRRSGYVKMLGASASANFKDAFDLIDVDGDGHITKAEMERVVDSVGEHNAGEEFIKAIEGSEDGIYEGERISLDDFMGMMAEAELYNLLTATFAALDEGGAGYVNAKKLDDVLRGVRGLISEDGKNVLTLDDKDILIDYEQFSKMLLKAA